MAKDIRDRRAYMREWRLKNYEKVLEKDAARKEHRKAYRQRPDVKEKRNEYMAKWRVENIERINAAYKKYKEQNRDVVLRRYTEFSFKRRYGITIAERDALLEAQGGICAICGSDTHRGKNWHIDHCHGSKKVRGILCTNCNVALGHAQDDVGRLKAMIAYLEKHNADD